MGSSAQSLPREPASHPDSGLIGWVEGVSEGPLLLCVGGLHGNEPAGVRALEALIDQVRARRGAMKGDFVAAVGNTGALAAGRRFLSYDMNRAWTEGRIDLSRNGHAPAGGHRRAAVDSSPSRRGVHPLRGRRVSAPSPEDLEMVRLLHLLDVIAERRRGPVHVLDLHTTSGRGGTFTTTADLARNRRFAMEIPVPLVLGLDEHLEGTLLGYLDQLAYTTTVCECGQHQEPRAVTRARAAVWLAVRAAGLLPETAIPEARRSFRIMRAARDHLPQVFETVHRHPVTSADRYRTRPGFGNFQLIRAGQIVGDDRHGEVAAPLSGRLLMPLYQELGEDGFFVVREVAERRRPADGADGRLTAN